MSGVALRVEGLGKRYRLGAKQEPYHSLRDSLSGLGKRLLPKGKSAREERKPEFWALKDVSFEVKHGEVLGVIGRNGAGKSTLLKLLSEITEPTMGRITINGRVAALLEVGTGFHAELTGRENIFLNGAILGMSRVEIASKFDEIVAFADVEKFLDTQVKHYSSGMYLRLAFAIAAHLEPEILIVDEVLAVGDAEFQKKCMGKMGAVSREGRTVLFVSHSMAAVESLCRSGIVLRKGEIQFTGTQIEAVTHYLSSSTMASTTLRNRTDRAGNGAVRIVAIELRDAAGLLVDLVTSGMDVDIILFYELCSTEIQNQVVASILAKNQLEVPIFLQHNRMTGDEFGPLPPSGRMICRLHRLPLPAATYRITINISSNNGYGEVLDYIDEAVEFTVVSGDYYGSGEVPMSSQGTCLVDASWRLESITPSTQQVESSRIFETEQAGIL